MVVRRRKKTRRIGGKTYSSFVRFKRKSSAKDTAKSYRSRGGLARVVKKKGKYKYEVYTRR